jgi:hypothetical protein
MVALPWRARMLQIAAQSPEMMIILPSLSVATHKPNVTIDLSGWSRIELM